MPQTKLKTIKEIKPDTFIFTQDNALTAEQCKHMIQQFESHQQDQYPGRIGQMATQDSSIKKSTDMVVSGKPHFKDIDSALFNSIKTALMEFREAYPFFKGPFKDMGYAIQRTQPGEHYHWHIDGGSHEFSQRQLVAVWYLNDVAGPGGETEFLFQGIKVTPQQGKLVLFPPFWTHEHRGVTLEKGVKYIATTWIVFR